MKHAPLILKVKEVNRENYSIRFVFSTGTTDRMNEVIDQKGWKLDNYLKNPVVLWAHDASKFPIGKGANMSNQGQLEGDVIFAYNENPEAAIAFELAAGGFLNAGSVGFDNLKWMYDEPTDTLTLLENELYEFSIVNIPANPEALAKAMDYMKDNHVDKKLIETVDTMRKDMETKRASRFNNLGEEVKNKEPESQEQKQKDKEDPAPEPEDSHEKQINAIVAAADAIETLSNCESGTIRAAVRELTSRLDAAESMQRRSSAAAPKKNSKRQLNRIIRQLANGKSNL